MVCRGVQEQYCSGILHTLIVDLCKNTNIGGTIQALKKIYWINICDQEKIFGSGIIYELLSVIMFFFVLWLKQCLYSSKQQQPDKGDKIL